MVPFGDYFIFHLYWDLLLNYFLLLLVSKVRQYLCLLVKLFGFQSRTRRNVWYRNICVRFEVVLLELAFSAESEWSLCFVALLPILARLCAKVPLVGFVLFVFNWLVSFILYAVKYYYYLFLFNFTGAQE